MIARVRGRLIHKDHQGAVVECSGVGYALAMSLASLAKLPELGKEVTLLAVTYLSQEALRLYGFAEAEERRAFEVLTGLTGVGPRLALAILSALSPAELAEAVEQSHKSVLTRIPGVGPKKAARLLVDLKDRLKLEHREQAASPARAGLQEDLISALTNLGFKSSEAQRTAGKAMAALPEQTDVAELVRQALRSSTSRP